MNRAVILSTGRLAGQVVRYHTWPTSREQNVGEHTWQVLRIYYLTFGPVPADTTTEIVFHDAGELVTGDPPFPLKARNPGLKAALDKVEAEAVFGYGVKLPVLTRRERQRIKSCDLTEMLEFGLHELYMGNRYGTPIVDDISVALRKLWSEPEVAEDRGAVSRYLTTNVRWVDGRSWSWI